MKEINIAKVIVNKRRERGITQDELAAFIGVSKASVSKWETGQSYPDVTFLPQLASYFGISVDELMDYKPQLTKEEIKKLYLRLSEDFAAKPFSEVLETCRTAVKKYFACYPLLVQMGILLINHAPLSESPTEALSITEEARELFRRVNAESDDFELKRLSSYMEAFCCLILGESNYVFSILGEKVEHPLPVEPLIASAFRVLGKNDEAKATLQTGIFKEIVVLFNHFSAYLPLCTGSPEKFYETLRRALAIAEVFDLKRLHPGLFSSFLLCAAQGCMAFDDKERALEMLNLYTETMTGNVYPMKLHGDSYFDSLDVWLKDLDLGNSLPRSERTIKRSMFEAVSENPAFKDLYDTPRFVFILDKLKSNCGDFD